MAEVALNGVSRRYGPTVAVDDLNLTVGDGELVVLLGPTGAGKTTTLRLVAGLERPDAGTVSIGGHPMAGVPPAGRDVAFVFQQFSLYPHLSVFDNLAFPLRSPLHRQPEPAVRARVEEIAALLRIGHKLGNRATRLSGGEMQRVAIGRALVRRPAVYLMDEPLSALDAKLRAGLRLELKRIKDELGTTILYVTHDQIEAMTLATRIGVLDRGRLLQIGTPREVYERPCSVHVAARLGTPAINLFPAGLLPAPGAPPGTRTIGARTEHLRLGPPDGSLGPAARPALVRRVEHLGDQSYLHLETGGHALVVLADPHAPLRAGDTIAVELVAPLCFDAAGDRIEAAPPVGEPATVIPLRRAQS
ncbi:ABC transporter ATP-binding protein [Azospirillum sp. TSO22-1]|uniref:ABC transporter ATP-binding protein n=1 Tax=Azospirillum sp. TSO22-1 TaxID=716789 RepID=UPI000D6124F6|nr:ABC transporter ATP-binding protein [Azospirillum sp. TSO22-1]PWC38143.1 ABC transporter ATP-binding protein [Azospirillum sp. TSO22-1]